MGGYFLFAWRKRAPVHGTLESDRDSSLVLGKREAIRELLALFDILSLGGAFYVPDEKFLVNQTFAQAIGLGGDSLEIQSFEVPFFREKLLQAVSSGKETEVPQAGLAFLPFFLGEGTLLLLEDKRKREKKFRSLQYFLSALWHEVQTPLTVLSGYIETLEENVPLPGEILARMRRQVQRLEGIVREIQNLGTLLREETEGLTGSEFSVLLQRVMGEKKEGYPTIRVVVETEEMPPHSVLSLSRGEAFVLLSNLLSNAFSFNIPFGEVRVGVSSQDSGLVVQVENTTTPFDIEFLSWFFDPAKTLPRGGSGKGIGLFLLQEVIEKVGGEIRLRTQKDRVLFEVFLPWGRREGKNLPSQSLPR